MTSTQHITPGGPLLRSLKSAALAVTAGALLWVAPTSALAGQKELDALKVALGAQPGAPNFANATGDQVAEAFKTVVTNTTLGFNAGIVAGEALKNALALDTGEKIANAIETDVTLVGIKNDKVPFVASAGATAAKSTTKDKLIYDAEVADLVSALSLTEQQAKDAAILSKVNGAAGRILAGFARLNKVGDTEKTNFAISMLADAKLKKAIVDIPRAFADEVTDSAVFTVKVVNAYVKSAAKIIPGAVAGDPTNAGEIFKQLYSDTNTTNVEALPILRKNAATLSKTAALKANIEEIQKIGNVLGGQIAKGKAFVALAKAATIAKNLATAIMDQPPTVRLANVQANSVNNKEDEIGEMLAYLASGLAASPELALDVTGKKGAAALFKLLTTVVKVKPKKIPGPLPDEFAADAASALANTIEKSLVIPQVVRDQFELLLNGPDPVANGKNIAKISKTPGVQALITAALGLIYDADPNNDGRFENGNDVAGAVSDPETDIHAFSGVAGQQS